MKYIGSLFFCWVVFIATAGLAIADDAKSGDLVPTGDIRSKFGYYPVVFYYAPDPSAPTLATAKKLAGKFFPEMAFVTDFKRAPVPPFIGYEEETAPLKNFPIPGDPYFKYAGRGLTPADIAAFRKTSAATQLVLFAPKDTVWADARRFTELVDEFATATNAYIWDDATRECFSRDAWGKQRLAGWKDSIPPLREQITIHLYQSSDTSPYLRAITLGMQKFALPDVVVEQLVASDNRPAGNLINLACQSLAENSQITNAARHVIRIAEIKNEKLRANFSENPKKGATGEIALAIVNARRDEGDPDNQLIELDFRNSPGRTVDERKSSALAALWGADDSIVGVHHDEELLAASARARARLPALQAIFSKGLQPGSRILLKAPFQRDDGGGNEWMWVEVLNWPQDGKITGILQNDPFYVSALRAGSRVLIDPAQVFDYIFYRADGTSIGNETGRIMENRQSPTLTK
jgi:uncharacterized protein YegJ (DUF2314 family)